MKKFKNILLLALILVINVNILDCKSSKKTNDTKKISFSVENTVQQHSRIKSLMLLQGDDHTLEQIAKIIKFDLNFTDQIDVHLKSISEDLEANALSKLFKQKISLCLYCKLIKKNKAQILLKDTHSKGTLFDQTFSYDKNSSVHVAHTISDKLIQTLTGNKGVSLSTLAYCKQFSSKRKVICVSDYAGKTEKTLSLGNTLNVAPRWHSKSPLIFFSQFTKTNGRLLSFNLETHRKKIICSYDGLNMQPSFSSDGKQVVLCLSARRGNSELYLFDQSICKKIRKRVFVPLTNNRGNNSSPCILPNGDIIFCSDFQTGSPQLYRLDHKNKQTRRLTNGKGYCAAPCYNKKTNKIVFIRPIKRVFQLCSINLNDKKLKETQLTFEPGDKLDPTWSPCGRHIAFTFDRINKHKKRIPQIAIYTNSNRKIQVITKSSTPKSFPTWTSSTFYRL